MRSIVAISSARRIGSWRGTSSALMLQNRLSVLPNIAAATVRGEFMKPSSASWCSERTTPMNPRESAHFTISIAARYWSA